MLNNANNINQDNQAPIGNLVPLYTVTQVAKYLGVSPHTVYRYIQEGRIKTVRIGQGYRFTPECLSDYIAECMIDHS